jgi:hypothetical protein
MPGAPNRPPEVSPAPAAPPVDQLERRVLRRLAPSRLALKLDVWKGAPSKDLLEPLAKAEALYAAGDHRGADSALDQLSVRLAEPRWPTIPEPFRQLRVKIPAPMPPHYDPEHALPAAEKELRQAKRGAETQLALAQGSVAWAKGHGVETADLEEPLRAAAAGLSGPTPADGFWTSIDLVWTTLRSRVPSPVPAPAAAAPTRSSA